MSLRFQLVPALLALFAPGLAAADIYTWTDERGVTVISNERPADMRKVKNFEVVAKSTERSPKYSSAAREPTATEQALLDRIDSLERQVRAQQYSPPPPPAPASTYSAVTYSTAPPAPPIYDTFATYPYVLPSYSFIVAPRSTFRPHRFGHRHHHHSHTGTIAGGASRRGR